MVKRINGCMRHPLQENPFRNKWMGRCFGGAMARMAKTINPCSAVISHKTAKSRERRSMYLLQIW
jgi:hypothetical protein